MIFLGGEVQALDGYVLVNNERVPDVETGRKILAAVDEALRKTGLRSVMFDTRDLPPPPDAVNRVLRAWVDAGANHDRVALLVRSDLKRIASNMRAQSKGVELRSFHDVEEAEVWLTEPSERVRTGSFEVIDPELRPPGSS
ncbi:MAG: hypothetical protein KC431_18150 [Myxococcales bacterium]|nr:hypothetical protein [Myxococcales bacterium]MCA9699454.1 hypothetical protein [Myxococcales bacterium]